MTEELLNKAQEKAVEIRELKQSISSLERIKEDLAGTKQQSLRISTNNGGLNIPKGHITDIITSILEAELTKSMKVAKEEFDNMK